MTTKIIAVDFDGCLAENAYPGIGPAIAGTVATLKAEQVAGAKVILWTCRHDEELTAAVEWCAAQGIHLDAVNANLPELIEVYGETRKVGATEYWDDKAVRAPIGHWFITEYEYFDCSLCGEAYYSGAESTAQAQHYIEQDYTYPYCPHCGAKMWRAQS